jgi:hypothetical protein
MALGMEMLYGVLVWMSGGWAIAIPTVREDEADPERMSVGRMSDGCSRERNTPDPPGRSTNRSNSIDLYCTHFDMLLL